AEQELGDPEARAARRVAGRVDHLDLETGDVEDVTIGEGPDDARAHRRVIPLGSPTDRVEERLLVLLVDVERDVVAAQRLSGADVITVTVRRQGDDRTLAGGLQQ